MILSNCDVILATLEEAAALVERGDAADVGHGALRGTAVGGGASVEVASLVKSAVAIAKVPAFPDPNPPDCSPILVPEGTITSACLLIHITKD